VSESSADSRAGVAPGTGTLERLKSKLTGGRARQEIAPNGDVSLDANVGLDAAQGAAARPANEVPRHIAIIMDGNHRWAKNKHLPGAAGHRAGAKNVKVVTKCCADHGVKYLTLFAFSTENWSRPSREVNLLIELMRGVLEDDVEELHESNVKLSIIGDRSAFARDLQTLMLDAEALTRDNDGMTLSIAINYGGRWDIAQAARKIGEEVAAGNLDPSSIDESSVEARLSLAGLPGPDLCVRTGGDRRISNFLLWDFAYTELYFTESFWPDFDDAQLGTTRQRRFGRR